jgi:hypothetical protein
MRGNETHSDIWMDQMPVPQPKSRLFMDSIFSRGEPNSWSFRETRKTLWKRSSLSSSVCPRCQPSDLGVERRAKTNLIDGEHILPLLEGAVPSAIFGVDLLITLLWRRGPTYTVRGHDQPISHL